MPKPTSSNAKRSCSKYLCASDSVRDKSIIGISSKSSCCLRGGEEDDEEDTKAKPTAGDAFDDVLYGSESELGDSDDEMPSAQQQRGGKRKDGGARLRVDDDEPMDLLAGAASRITSECKILH